ncbi:hypothetical protein [Azospirillum sp. Marseille-Q6669]
MTAKFKFRRFIGAPITGEAGKVLITDHAMSHLSEIDDRDKVENLLRHVKNLEVAPEKAGAKYVRNSLGKDILMIKEDNFRAYVLKSSDPKNNKPVYYVMGVEKKNNPKNEQKDTHTFHAGYRKRMF